jgi:hypothetical protein
MNTPGKILSCIDRSPDAMPTSIIDNHGPREHDPGPPRYGACTNDILNDDKNEGDDTGDGQKSRCRNHRSSGLTIKINANRIGTTKSRFRKGRSLTVE